MGLVIKCDGFYVAVWGLMYVTLDVSWWLTLPLAVLVGGLLVRVFIIFHDCGHGSFFESRVANHIVGFTSAILTFTPYYQWPWDHALHHPTSGHLDRPGVGVAWTMTVEEEPHASRLWRFAYR